MISLKLINIIILIILMHKCTANPTKCQNCKQYDDCESFKYLYRRGMKNDSDYCNKEERIVCCEPEDKNTPAEASCYRFTNIQDFCPTVELIKNGEKTSPHEMPFIALIQERYSTEKEYNKLCSGALIESKYVLTAAHCFRDDSNIKYFAVLGNNPIDSGTRFEGKFIKHPQYGNDYSYNNDIALFELAKPAKLNTKEIKPACLAKDNFSEVQSKTYMTAGWDQDTSSRDSTDLYKLSLISNNLTECGESFKHDKVFCTTTKDHKGAVQPGDSGSPVFKGYPDLDNCVHEIIGIVSIGPDETTDISSAYSIQTNVFYYRKWIESIVWK